MGQLPIDVDSESIQLDGKWYTRDELARKIKSMLDAGDYQIARPSQALEELNQTLAAVRTLAFRATLDMAEALNAAAARANRSVGSIIREAVQRYLGMAGAEARRQPEAPAIEPPNLKQASVPIAGPGALRMAQAAPSVIVDKAAIVTEEASPEEAAQAVDLTPKKKADEEAVERRWFGI